jgi:hypothetical protein
VPVILSSGYLDPGTQPDIFQGFLQKPYRVSDLLSAIRRVRGAQGRTAPDER